MLTLCHWPNATGLAPDATRAKRTEQFVNPALPAAASERDTVTAPVSKAVARSDRKLSVLERPAIGKLARTRTARMGRAPASNGMLPVTDP